MKIMVDEIPVENLAGLTREELQAIVAEEKELYAAQKKILGRIQVSADCEDYIVESWPKSPIKRIRRITGYLSEVDNFNSAKRAELNDRITHY